MASVGRPDNQMQGDSIPKRVPWRFGRRLGSHPGEDMIGYISGYRGRKGGRERDQLEDAIVDYRISHKRGS